MSGGGFGGSNPNKIKGGRWTVVRFFLVSIAHSIGWFTVSSLLGKYSHLYGPQILLMMNIAYYLPSIPLLLLSASCDDWLDRTFGVPRVIMARLLFGLGGCALITALFPFIVQSARMLLLVIVALGLVSAIAFSASYQLVARFANKSVIALGLGCVGSGLIVLVLEMAVHLRHNPSQGQLIWLFELTAGFIMAGFAASVSLLLRHWKSIEKWSAEEAPPQQQQQQRLQDLEQPLMSQEGLDFRESQGLGERSEGSLSRRRSIPLLLNYSPLDFMESMSEGDAFNGDALLLSGTPGRSRSTSLDLAGPNLRGAQLSREISFRRAASEQPLSTIEEVAAKQFAIRSAFRPSQLGAIPGTPTGSATSPAGLSPKASTTGHSPQSGEVSGAAALADVVRQCWPVLGALFFSGTFFVLAFPFFTYVPSGGTFGHELPQVLFFSRLAADVCGRTLPRVKRLVVRSRYVLFSFGLIMSGSIPGFLWYIKASPWHNDWAVTAYVVIMWILGGYVNTCSYVVAPACVEPHLKAAANGLLAITYQTAHCTGLILATVITAAFFGGISPI